MPLYPPHFGHLWLLLVGAASGQAFTPPPDAQWRVGPSRPYGNHAVADVNGDDVLDVAWVTADELLVATGSASGGFPDPPTATPLGVHAEASGLLAAADLNADGYADLFFRAGSEVTGWPGSPTGPGKPWGLPDARILRGIGDVDGDGGADLALDTSLWLSDPTGPAAGPQLPNSEGESALFPAGDVDGDGHGDVAGSDLTRDAGGGWYDVYTGPLALYLGGPPPLSSTPLWTYSRPDTAAWDLTAADLDGDGTRELVAAFVRVLDEAAVGSLVALGGLDSPDGPTVLSETALDVDVGQGFALATLGDRDGDGAEEVLLGLEGRLRTVAWSEATGFDLEGAPALSWASDQGATLVSLVTADLDRDGLVDVTARWLHEGAPGDPGTITVWYADPEAATGPGDTETADTGSSDTGKGDDPSTGSPSAADRCGCALGAAPGATPGVALAWLLLRRRRRR